MVADTAKDVAAPRLALADYYMATNRAAEGVKLLETVAQMKDGRSPASIRLAQYEYGNGQKAAAHARLDKLMAAEPKNVDAMLSKAALLASDGNLDAALRQATAATSAAPRLARAHFAVANIDESKGDVEHAEKAYQEALRLDPGFGAASLGLARLYLATGRGDQAVQFADQAVKDMPHRADGYYLLVRALMARGERDRTELQLKPLLARFGNLSKVQSLAGLVAASRSDSVAARKAFESALKIDPGNNEALSGLTAVDLADRKPADAVRRIEARRASAPTDVAALALAGRTYQMIGQPAQAEAAWKQVLERDGSNIEAYGSLAQLYMQQKRLPEARQEFERVAERHPKLAAAQTMVGYLLDLENRKPEALKRYQKALEIDPRSAVAANNAAWLYAEGAGNLETALQLAQTAKSGLPDSHEVNDTLGWIYYKKGMTTMALGPLFQAVDKAPKNAVYQFHLGMALAKNGEKDRARAALQAALAIDPNFDGAADARQTLASLR
jgi:tetratricopeptide (TPR) repeat protein